MQTDFLELFCQSALRVILSQCNAGCKRLNSCNYTTFTHFFTQVQWDGLFIHLFIEEEVDIDTLLKVLLMTIVMRQNR